MDAVAIPPVLPVRTASTYPPLKLTNKAGCAVTKRPQAIWAGAGAVIVALGLGSLVIPITVSVAANRLDKQVAQVAAPRIRVQSGPPLMDVVGASTIILGALNAVLGGSGTVVHHPARFPVFGHWVAVAAVMTPKQWQWRMMRGSWLAGNGEGNARRDARVVGQALRHWWVVGYRLGGAGAPLNTAPFAYVRGLTQSVATTTLALPPLEATLAHKGQYNFAAPLVCLDLTATTASQCNAITVLWVRWRSARQAAHVPLGDLPYGEAASR